MKVIYAPDPLDAASRPREDPFENGVDVPELLVQVERLLDLGGASGRR